MRRIASQVWIEDKYPSGEIGVIASEDEVLLIDAPLLVDDVKQWLTEVEEIGTVRYVALLDSYPDRVLGTRALDLPRIGHDLTLESIREWSDTFKGNTHPIGAQADRLKRVTGNLSCGWDLKTSAYYTVPGLDRDQSGCWKIRHRSFS
jgi:hypothetical protein